jgi:thiol-disulfide isomerase/thioredoxin
MTGVVTAIVALSVATIIGLVWRRGNGVLRPRKRADVGPGSEPESSEPETGPELGPEFGSELGERATLVQFSSAFCAPCRATRSILNEIAEMVDGVRYVEIDAESRLDLVRRLDVLRTPTVLVLDGDGRIVRRGSGRPRKADVIAALGDAIPGPPPGPSRAPSPAPSSVPSPAPSSAPAPESPSGPS